MFFPDYAMAAAAAERRRMAAQGTQGQTGLTPEQEMAFDELLRKAGYLQDAPAKAGEPVQQDPVRTVLDSRTNSPVAGDGAVVYAERSPSAQINPDQTGYSNAVEQGTPEPSLEYQPALQDQQGSYAMSVLQKAKDKTAKPSDKPINKEPPSKWEGKIPQRPPEKEQPPAVKDAQNEMEKKKEGVVQDSLTPEQKAQMLLEQARRRKEVQDSLRYEEMKKDQERRKNLEEKLNPPAKPRNPILKGLPFSYEEARRNYYENRDGSARAGESRSLAVNGDTRNSNTRFMSSTAAPDRDVEGTTIPSYILPDRLAVQVEYKGKYYDATPSGDGTWQFMVDDKPIVLERGGSPAADRFFASPIVQDIEQRVTPRNDPASIEAGRYDLGTFEMPDGTLASAIINEYGNLYVFDPSIERASRARYLPEQNAPAILKMARDRALAARERNIDIGAAPLGVPTAPAGENYERAARRLWGDLQPGAKDANIMNRDFARERFGDALQEEEQRIYKELDEQNQRQMNLKEELSQQAQQNNAAGAPPTNPLLAPVEAQISLLDKLPNTSRGRKAKIRAIANAANVIGGMMGRTGMTMSSGSKQGSNVRTEVPNKTQMDIKDNAGGLAVQELNARWHPIVLTNRPYYLETWTPAAYRQAIADGLLDDPELQEALNPYFVRDVIETLKEEGNSGALKNYLDFVENSILAMRGEGLYADNNVTIDSSHIAVTAPRYNTEAQIGSDSQQESTIKIDPPQPPPHRDKDNPPPKTGRKVFLPEPNGYNDEGVQQSLVTGSSGTLGIDKAARGVSALGAQGSQGFGAADVAKRAADWRSKANANKDKAAADARNSVCAIGDEFVSAARKAPADAVKDIRFRLRAMFGQMSGYSKDPQVKEFSRLLWSGSSTAEKEFQDWLRANPLFSLKDKASGMGTNWVDSHRNPTGVLPSVVAALTGTGTVDTALVDKLGGASFVFSLVQRGALALHQGVNGNINTSISALMKLFAGRSVDPATLQNDERQEKSTMPPPVP